jgi:hypothetical protein
MTKQAKEDPRIAHMSKNLPPYSRQVLSSEAIADLQFFADNKIGGQSITFDGLRSWMKEHHNVDAGRQRMATHMKEAGREPWWKP